MHPKEYPNVVHSNWLHTIILDISVNRNLLVDELNKLGIETRPVFYNLNLMPPYIKYKSSKNLYNSSKIANYGLSLPSSLSLQAGYYLYL